jgi:hypothetical protein
MKERRPVKRRSESHTKKVCQSAFLKVQAENQLEFTAGTPLDLNAPTDEERLLMINLEAGAGQKRAAIWHVHVVETTEAAVAAQSKW